MHCYCLDDCAACDPRHCKDGEYRDGELAPVEQNGDTGPHGTVSLGLYGSGSSPILAKTKVLAQPSPQVFAHAQAYGAGEAAKFKTAEVAPLVDEADKNSWLKLPGA